MSVRLCCAFGNAGTRTGACGDAGDWCGGGGGCSGRGAAWCGRWEVLGGQTRNAYAKRARWRCWTRQEMGAKTRTVAVAESSRLAERLAVGWRHARLRLRSTTGSSECERWWLLGCAVWLEQWKQWAVGRGKRKSGGGGTWEMGTVADAVGGTDGGVGAKGARR